MRFGVVHRVMTDTLAVLGLLALLTSGELDRTMGYTIIAAMVVALVLPERVQDRPLFRNVMKVAPLGLLGVQVLRLAGGEEPADCIHRIRRRACKCCDWRREGARRTTSK